ncbi:MAG: hypothetical protein HY741_26530 [Chloroflexi bacterium]|nr:hypothetical protein [Chloroflexota bacterium]
MERLENVWKTSGGWTTGGARAFFDCASVEDQRGGWKISQDMAQIIIQAPIPSNEIARITTETPSVFAAARGSLRSELAKHLGSYTRRQKWLCYNDVCRAAPIPRGEDGVV